MMLMLMLLRVLLRLHEVSANLFLVRVASDVGGEGWLTDGVMNQ